MLADGESLSQHAALAAQRALGMAGVGPADVDLIILCTSSPDDLFGSACQARSSSGALASAFRRIWHPALHAALCKGCGSAECQPSPSPRSVVIAGRAVATRDAWHAGTLWRGV